MTYSMQTFESPVGPIHLVASASKLCGIVYPKMWPRFKELFKNPRPEDTPILAETRRQLTEYFEGKRKTFDIPLGLEGTTFQRRVWSALRGIGYGETRSYKQQAQTLSSPLAIRAVGRANGLNPISIVIPCHRVVGSDGSLTGYAGGLEAKQFLLHLERAASMA